MGTTPYPGERAGKNHRLVSPPPQGVGHPVTGPSPDISVVLPVYRNADTLHQLHRRLRYAVEALNHSYEILFVEDACPEGSLSVLKELADSDSHVGVGALERNVGRHPAGLTGFAPAPRTRAGGM